MTASNNLPLTEAIFTTICVACTLVFDKPCYSNSTSSSDKLKFWQIVLIVAIVTIFGVIAVALWIAVGIMVSSPPNDSK